jgi:hypothetical protein
LSPVYFVTNLKFRNLRTYLFDDSRYLGAQNERQRLESNLAFPDEGIPITPTPAAFTRISNCPVSGLG